MSDIKPNMRVFFFIVLAYLFAGCKKDQILTGNQQILFHVDYRNEAWGPEHSGFFIDSKGNVITYNNPEEWNNYDNFYHLSEDKLKQNLLRCQVSDKKIPEQDILKYSNYIKNIASSKVSARRNVANDAGKTEFVCYQFSESTGTYQGYLIKLEGDYTSENLNFYSRKVASWLREISEAISPR
jgi:hypothetical protein